MNLRTQPVATRGDEKLRDIYSDASDIPVATRVHHTMADEMVRRWNDAPRVEADSVEWVVNDNAELGVKIGHKFFWLYKGYSFVYEDGKHDAGNSVMWRPVGKREFGEVCYPVKFYKTGNIAIPYTEPLKFIRGLSFGKPDDFNWKPLP